MGSITAVCTEQLTWHVLWPDLNTYLGHYMSYRWAGKRGGLVLGDLQHQAIRTLGRSKIDAVWELFRDDVSLTLRRLYAQIHQVGTDGP